MKKLYQEPLAERVVFLTEDVIMASGAEFNVEDFYK